MNSYITRTRHNDLAFSEHTYKQLAEVIELANKETLDFRYKGDKEGRQPFISGFLHEWQRAYDAGYASTNLVPPFPISPPPSNLIFGNERLEIPKRRLQYLLDIEQRLNDLQQRITFDLDSFIDSEMFEHGKDIAHDIAWRKGVRDAENNHANHTLIRALM